MNRIYSLVWNRALHILQVASELATSGSNGNAALESGATRLRRHPLALACAAALALGAFTLPAWSAGCTVNSVTYADCTQGTNGQAGGAGTTSTGGAGGTGSNSGSNNGGAGGAHGPGADGQGKAGGKKGGSSETGGHYGAYNGGGGAGAAGAGVPPDGGGGGGGSLYTQGYGSGGGGGGGGDTGSLIGGGGGGGGGLGAQYTTSTTITAGHAVLGGAGGHGSVNNSYGGGGGGGAGVWLSGGTLSNLGLIAGGAGGAGGGFNGGGGAGLLMSAGTTLVNGGYVAGGNGGNQAFDSSGGGGGAAVAVAAGGGYVDNESAGSIVGGTAGDCYSLCEHRPGASGGIGVLALGSLQLNNAGSIAGGAGGNAVANGFQDNGGAGGAGLLVVGGASGPNNQGTNSGTVTGGAGGSGGPALFPDVGGAGGAGGAGADLTNFALTNASGGSITGGAGGAGGAGNTGVHGGAPGAGGVGVLGRGGVTLIDAGSIVGGVAGDGTTQADAVDFSGGGNSLTLENGYSFTGNVVSTSGSTNGGDTFALGGTGDGTFNVSEIVASAPASSTGTPQIFGFGTYKKTGSSTWTLTGTGQSGQDWTIVDGTLAGDATAFADNIDFEPGTSDTAAVVFDQGTGNTNSPATGTFAGAITGDGRLTKTDNGTLILTGASNSWSGGTTISSGTLQIGDGGADGSIGGGAISDDGRLVFDRSAGVTLDATITGFGSLTQDGTGVLTVNGSGNHFSGGTFINAGTLEVAAGGKLGTGAVTVDNSADHDAKLQVDTGARLANHILLNNGGTLDNAGTLDDTTDFYTVLSNAGGASVTNHDGGVIDGTFASIRLVYGGTVTNTGAGSTLHNSRSDGSAVIFSDAYGKVINSDGASISGGASGVAVFAGGEVTNTGAGSSISSPGFGVFIGGDGGTVKNTDGGTIAGSSAGIVLVVGGDVTNTGAGSTISSSGLTAAGAYSGSDGMYADGYTTVENMDGATIVGTAAGVGLANGGSITNGAGSTIQATGSAQGECWNTGDCAIVVASASDGVGLGGALNFTNAGSVLGNVQMDPDAANATTLTAGGTIQGYLDIGPSPASTLTLNGDAGTSAFYSGAVSGTTTFVGDLTKDGEGTWLIDNAALAGVSGTTVAGGTLIVGAAAGDGGALTNGVTVDAGATLGGVGTVGSADVSGTLAPGDGSASIGTLHVTGNATFDAGSVFAVDAAPHKGDADQLAVGGSVTINGGTVQIEAQSGDWKGNTKYTIITTGSGHGHGHGNSGGGITGTFDSVSANFAFLDASLKYHKSWVTLSLKRNHKHFSAAAETANEASVATVEDALGWRSPLYDALVNLTSADAAAAFNRTAGAFHASQQTVRIDDSRYIREAMNARLAGDGGHSRTLSLDGGVSTWVQGWGAGALGASGVLAGVAPAWGSVGGSTGKLANDGSGVLVGADWALGSHGRMGVVSGFSRDNASEGQWSAWGTLRSQWMGLFAGYAAGPFTLRSGMAYAWDQMPVERMVAFPGFREHLSDHTSGRTVTGYVEGAWALRFRHGDVEPFVNLAEVRVATSASTEVGGSAALQVATAAMNATFGTLGTRGAWRIAKHVDLTGELGWRHAFGGVTPASRLRFVDGGDAFTVYGVPLARDAGVGELGLAWHASARATFTANYDGLIGRGVHDNAARLNVAVAF